jgi:hypothetical protein
VPGRVRRVDPVTGIIAMVAGGGSEVACGVGRGDGGPARGACVAAMALAVGPDGTLVIADGHRLRSVDPETGSITSAPYVADPFTGFGGLAFDVRGAVVASHSGRVMRIGRDEEAAVVIAGNGSSDVCGDGGPADEACIGRAWDVAVDGGDVLIAEGRGFGASPPVTAASRPSPATAGMPVPRTVAVATIDRRRRRASTSWPALRSIRPATCSCSTAAPRRGAIGYDASSVRPGWSRP